MAKRTKFKNDNVTTDDSKGIDASGKTPDASILPTNIDISAEAAIVPDIIPDVISEFEQGKIIELNIIHKDDYVKFIELAIKYNLFNNIEDLNCLHKSDLCALIGFIINTLYTKEIELELNKSELIKIKNEESAQKQTSFDKPISYSDLFGDLNTYKSWN